MREAVLTVALRELHDPSRAAARERAQALIACRRNPASLDAVIRIT